MEMVRSRRFARVCVTVMWTAVGACGGRAHDSEGAAPSGSSASASAPAASARPAPPAPRPPAVALLRCAPAPVLPVEPVGILGSLALQQGGAFASLTGKGDISSGLDDSHIVGGLIGDDVGQAFGAGGLGLGGKGAGGGGIGMGTIGTLGHGSGVGDGYGPGGGMRRHRSAARVTGGAPDAQGGLDAAVIGRYVRRRMPAIERCYESALRTQPDLAGPVSVEFVIGADGKVSSAHVGGGASAVDRCVEGVFKGIQFPAPDNGATVRVTYPFTMSPAAPAQPRVGPAPARSRAARAPAPPAWTPYASNDSNADDKTAGVVTLATQAAVQTRLGAIDACFGAAAGGSVRAILEVRGDGAVDLVRAGGLGDERVERCLEGELASLRVSGPDHPVVEVACDLARGPEVPWRLTPSRYHVIEVGARTIRNGGAESPIDPPPHLEVPPTYVAVIADADATGAGLRAVAAVARNRYTVYGVRVDGGPPLYAGVAATPPMPGEYHALTGPRLDVRLRADRAEVCIAKAGPKRTAPLVELDHLFAGLADVCKQHGCSDAAMIDVRELSDAATLHATIAHLRGIGVTRVVIGDVAPGC
jgi:hypothetical protein